MKSSTSSSSPTTNSSMDTALCKDIEHRIKAVIRYSLKRTAEEGEKYAKEMEKEKSIKMPKTNESKSYSFKDFRPLDFGMLRKLCGMNDRDYFASIGHSKFEWHEMNGKSGSMFALTEDRKLMIKTISKDESKTIRNVIVPQLLEYMKNEPNTFIVPIFGLHKFSLDNKSELRFVVMKYLFQPPPALPSSQLSTSSPSTSSSLVSPSSPSGTNNGSTTIGNGSSHGMEMDKIYDLKGSTTDRTAKEGETILKDVDLMNENIKFNVGQDLATELLFQFKKDVNFLTSCEVMDYSLVVGIMQPKDTVMDVTLQNYIKYNREEKLRDKFHVMANTTPNKQEYYFLGIVDYFTKYGLMKKAAKNIKSMKNDPSTISTVPPSSYSDRFMQFIFKIFV